MGGNEQKISATVATSLKHSLFFFTYKLKFTSTHLSCHKPAPHEHHSASHSEHISNQDLRLELVVGLGYRNGWLHLQTLPLPVDGGKIGLFMITVLSCHLSCLRDCD